MAAGTTRGAHLGAEELSPFHQKLLTNGAVVSGPPFQLNKFQQIIFLRPGKVTRSRGSKLGALISSSPLAADTPGTALHGISRDPFQGAPREERRHQGDTLGQPADFVLLPGLVSRGAVCAGGGTGTVYLPAVPFAGLLSACSTWGCAWSTSSPALALQPPRPPTPPGV